MHPFERLNNRSRSQDYASIDGRSEGGERADGAAKGRQMQASTGHWRSLPDTRKRILTRTDSA